MKAVLNQAGYDALEAPFKPLYKPQGDKFVLSLEGTEEHPDVVNLNSALAAERRDRSTRERELADLKTKMGDLDPEAAKAAMRRVAELEAHLAEGDIPKQFEKQFNNAVDSRVTSMKRDYENKIAAFEAQTKTANETVTTLQSKLEELTIDNAVRSEAVKAGLHEWAVEDAVMHARSIYRLDQKTGLPVPIKPGTKDEILYGKNPRDPMPVSEWLSNKLAEKPGWVKESSGGGANGGRTGSNGGGGGKKFTMTKTEAKNTTAYRAMRAEARKVGMDVEIVNDPA